MVLLNLLNESITLTFNKWLTFHYGAIEPIILLTFLLGVSVLTFHYGAIEPRDMLKASAALHLLTFHYGAIEPIWKWGCCSSRN